jgi:hypothetical protein
MLARLENTNQKYSTSYFLPGYAVLDIVYTIAKYYSTVAIGRDWDYRFCL